MERVTPIYVLGVGHSGTTILYKMVALHPDTTWFSQYSQRGGVIPGRTRMPFGRTVERALRVAIGPDWRKETGSRRRTLRRAIVPSPNEARPIWSHLLPLDHPIDDSESVRRIRTMFEAEHRFWGKPFLVTKPLWLFRHLDVLHAAYPNAKFVHIVRDGRAVALSLRPKFSRRGESPREALGAAAARWVDVLSRVDAARGDMDVTELRYEDLCEDVPGNLRRVLSFAGPAEDRYPFHRCPSTLTPTNSKWLGGAKAWELEILDDVQREYLERYGYAAIA